MKFIKLTFEYWIKNFGILVLLSIIPAVFIGLFISPFASMIFAMNYKNMQIEKFSDIFSEITNLTFEKFSLAILSCVILIIFTSIILGYNEQNMRIGKPNKNDFSKYLNNNFLLVFKNTLAVIIFIFINNFLTCGIIFLSHIVISGIGCVPVSLSKFIVTFVIIVKSCINLIVLMYACINAMDMVINGFKTFESLSRTITLMSKHFWQLLLAVILPFLVVTPLFFVFSQSRLIGLAKILGMILLFCYYSSFASVSYFEMSLMQRVDKKKYFMR